MPSTGATPTRWSRLFAPEGEVQVEAFDGVDAQRYDGLRFGDLLATLAPFERTFHHVGGAVYDVTDGGAAGRVHCAAHHYRQGRDGPTDLVLFVRYLDRYQRHPQRGWLILGRQVRVEWSERVPARPVESAR